MVNLNSSFNIFHNFGARNLKECFFPRAIYQVYPFEIKALRKRTRESEHENEMILRIMPKVICFFEFHT